MDCRWINRIFIANSYFLRAIAYRRIDMDPHSPHVGLGGGLASPIPQIATWWSERPGAAEPSITGRICGR